MQRLPPRWRETDISGTQAALEAQLHLPKADYKMQQGRSYLLHHLQDSGPARSMHLTSYLPRLLKQAAMY
jgi:hypothetical protein